MGKTEPGFILQGLSATMESLNVESEDMVYKAMARLEHAQDKLPWAEKYRQWASLCCTTGKVCPRTMPLKNITNYL